MMWISSYGDGTAKNDPHCGIDFDNLEDAEFDVPFGLGSGAAQIFGITGGVMEAALRTVYEVVTGNSLEERLEFTAVRGFKGIREASLQIGELTVKVAIVHGLANAKKMLELSGKARQITTLLR
ncbi:MAG: [Fe-Fe] hydrogenase large subunit C-terminal domain-containing protein [Clostridium sp.]